MKLTCFVLATVLGTALCDKFCPSNATEGDSCGLAATCSQQCVQPTSTEPPVVTTTTEDINMTTEISTTEAIASSPKPTVVTLPTTANLALSTATTTTNATTVSSTTAASTTTPAVTTSAASTTSTTPVNSSRATSTVAATGRKRRAIVEKVPVFANCTNLCNSTETCVYMCIHHVDNSESTRYRLSPQLLLFGLICMMFLCS